MTDLPSSSDVMDAVETSPAGTARPILLRRRAASPVARWSRLRGDAIALGIFLALAALTMWHRWTYDNWLLDYDILTFFLPWYGVLGDRLRDFDVPGWTRHFSSGAPLAGDPSAGWMYWPVMIAFTLFERASAFKTMIAIQVLVGGLATYALGRRLGFQPPAALTATLAFAFGPFLYGQTAYATVGGQVTTWIPLGILGVEMALRADRWMSRIAWWWLAGLAIAQMAVAWPGQGLMNGALVMAAWIAYRAVLSPVDAATPWRARLAAMLTTGLATFAFGLALSAAGLLPRLAVNGESSIPGGDYSGVRGGGYGAPYRDVFHLLRQVLAGEIAYRPVALGGVVVVLVLLAPLLARTRYAVPFFLGITAVAMMLSVGDTIVWRIFAVIPMFETIHEHSPRRILWVVGLAPAMLAGATAQALLERRFRPRTMPLLVVPLAIVIALVLVMPGQGQELLGGWPVGTALATTGLALLASGAVAGRFRRHAGTLTRSAIIGLIALLFIAPAGRDILHTLADPTAARSPERDLGPTRRLHSDPASKALLEHYLRTEDPGTAADFLQSRRDDGELFRYVGYAGRFWPTASRFSGSYSRHRLVPGVVNILVNGRAGTLQLDTVQTYNPMTLRSYVDYIDTMNGRAQDYHWVDPYPPALYGSPLLDMLNVRYIIVPRTIASNRRDISAIRGDRAVVYQDRDVTIYENAGAFDRAWIVHDVRSDVDGTGLARIADGSVDGRAVAFVDGAPPPVATPDPAVAGTESVTITSYRDDDLAASVELATGGLVVFSEVYASGWNAYVDGERVTMLRTNEALRGVPVPAGRHTITMRYEPVSLTVGMWVTGLTSIGVLPVLGWNAGALLRPASPGERPDSRPGPDGRRGIGPAGRGNRDTTRRVDG